MTKNIIELENIQKTFGKVTVVSSASLKIPEGKIIGIVGRNGSGKTVLLKIITGIYFASAGKYILHGKEVTKGTEISNQFGILIDTGFIPEISGIKNLLLLADLSKKATKKDCFHVMERVGLDPFSKKSMGSIRQECNNA